MGQRQSFQRSDTIQKDTPEHSGRLSDSHNEEPNSSAEQSEHWGVHTQASELFHDFHASDNSLINLSAELLALMVTLPQQQNPASLPELRENLVSRVSAMNNRGRLYGHPQSLMDRASYVLCAALDEGINKTNWGRARGWENHSLLSRLFQQRNGGEVFFVLLEQAKQQAEPNSELLELMYVLLRLGFQGRYLKAGSSQEAGYQSENHELSRMASELYSDLRRVRPAPKGIQPPPPTTNWHPLKQYRRTPWIVAVPALLIAGYLTTFLWVDNYNENRMLGLDALQSWQAPASSEGDMMYESTADDMGAWQL
ncbi:hypothetical protein EOPP23_06670 [Endozoicomonas sp. OPT23]|uniref:type IVB secretion system protein IcmH/DotU n=1 Tax=Endozoicomonas sp. OPT23 TaxID=2072845 RepID=UPI00129C00CF|nr:type IVB secretion system protein IcmH/DotU [Endozoicomonas sp. OPT23]MRI32670.1 hypothetical protein [Endozoicomonas sp. OPT23]